MEVIGDSSLVEQAKAKGLVKFEADSIEFERNLDSFKKTLENEEDRLLDLEARRVKIQQDIEEMYRDITEEKQMYRKAMDEVIKVHETISRNFINSCSAKFDPIASSMSLIEECKSAIESSKVGTDIDIDIEKIRCELMENYISTKESYLSTMKERYQQKKLKIDSQIEHQQSEPK